MDKNPLLELERLGQSIWIDFFQRSALESGEIRDLIARDGVSGVTSNPSIFEKDIAGSHAYDAAVRTLARAGRRVEEIYLALTVEDIRQAADLFRPVYDRTEGRDGFVSLEVSPLLAHDTAGTVAEARHLWSLVDRPNLMVKVPATREGVPAIQVLIAEGINVNITLLFSLDRYRRVVEAYLAGLETLALRGAPLEKSASVASFFLSRIDVLADALLDKVRPEDGLAADAAAGLQGELAIASARLAYRNYQEIFGGRRFRALAAAGARPQRLLWASTSTKNPAYSDVKYVEPLIGRETVNTLPLETLSAYRDHGQPALRLEQGVEEASQALDRLAQTGIDLETLTQQLEVEGVEKFTQAYRESLAVLEAQRTAALNETAVHQRPAAAGKT